MADTRFSKTRQPARRNPTRTSWRQKVIDALKEQELTEDDFVAFCVKKALDDSYPNQSKLIDVVINRLEPVKKAVMPTYKFKLDPKATPADKIDKIIEAVAREEIPPDVASLLVNMVKTGQEVRETTELVERLERVEQMLIAQNQDDDA